MKKWVISKIGNPWREWKNYLKDQNYDPDMPLPQQYLHVDSRVDLAQWKNFVDYLRTTEAKAIAQRNKENQEKLTMSHTAGAKSYARYHVEQRKAHPEGQDPDRMEMFQATHTKRDGSFVDAESAARMRQMEDIVSEHPEGSDRSTVQNETFKQVMGPDGHGRVRMYGYSVMPTQMRGASAAAETEHWRRMCEDAQVRATASDARQTELSSIVASQGDMITVLQNTVSKMEGFMRNFGREVNNMPSFSSFDTDSTQPPDATQR